ncbi:hypothetical protein ACH49_26980 [Streptomyces leeuwenhoekii]|uniref:Uncharacterized protein n=1 Tax=Streptomyces leeuwenhoekii TaxID=1437453 RepID=A0ABR5HRT7_STRLW|nr:hypothetical protein ACH49_26980 [Streptomyces leeuwenhoekii]
MYGRERDRHEWRSRRRFGRGGARVRPNGRRSRPSPVRPPAGPARCRRPQAPPRRVRATAFAPGGLERLDPRSARRTRGRSPPEPPGSPRARCSRGVPRRTPERAHDEPFR